MRLLQKVAFIAIMAFVLSQPLRLRADTIGCFDGETGAWCEANGPSNGYTCDSGTCYGSYSSCLAQAYTDCLNAANRACADNYTPSLDGADEQWEIYCDVGCGLRGGPQACL